MKGYQVVIKGNQVFETRKQVIVREKQVFVIQNQVVVAQEQVFRICSEQFKRGVHVFIMPNQVFAEKSKSFCYGLKSLQKLIKSSAPIKPSLMS